MANVKITALTNIGSNILYSALIPMVNMAGTPVTQQGNIQILGNYILSGAGSANFAPAYLSNLAYSVVNAAQPNITSVGTLTSLAVTGNVAANLFIGDGGLLTNVSSAGTSIANGTSNVSIPAAGGNINISRGGVANVLVVTGTGVNVAGTLNSTGNLVSGNLTTTNINVTGNVTSNLRPSANVTYDLGSTNQRWKDIWLANSTIYLGDATISATGNSIVVDSITITDGNVGNIGNIASVNLNGDVNNVLRGDGTWGAGGSGGLPLANGDSNFDIATANGNATITANNTTWTFGNDGNLTLPNNTFAINYANGDPVTLGGNTIGNFVVTGNMFMLNDPNIDMVIQQSSTDLTSIRLIPDGQPEPGVHIETGSGMTMYHWVFTDSGNLISPGNVILEGSQIFAGPGASELPNIANATLVISSNSEAYIQAVINNVSDIGSADWIAQGHYGDDDGGYADFGFNSASGEDPAYSLTGPGDGYILVQGYYSGQGPAIGGGNLVLATGVEGLNRDIIFGMNGYTSANMFAKMSDANTALEFTRPGTILRFGDNSTLGEILGAGANTFGITATANSNVLIKTSHFDGAFSTEYVWQFGENGTFIPPTLEVDLHNGGNQLGQVLQFGDPGYQAIITGPTPEANVNAQRLIIQGQRGNGELSEGGDVYLWAGDANTNGGDIKIYAGDADDASAGYGGYINLDGGSGYDGGGEITLTGGSSANGIGGGVGIYSGSGTHTSNITIQSGQSSSANFVGGGIVIEGGYSLGNSGGAVSVKGGESSLGIADYGNVLVQAGASTWIFDNDGVVSAYGNLKLAPDSANADSYLDIFLTSGPDLHLVASASANLILGKDDQANVMTSWDGNVTIQSWDTNTNTQGGVWTFDGNGNLTIPKSINGNGNAQLDLGNYINEAYLTTTTDDSTALWLEATDAWLYASDNVNISSSNTNVSISASSAVIINTDTSNANQTWTFDGDGNLILPGNAIAINYADGNRIFGNVTFRDEIVIGTGTSNLISGLYLAPSSSSANADMYLRVRGNVNDEPTHIHFDTGNNQYYNQYIGDDNKYILLANTGNIVINSNDGVGNSAQWIFGNNGTLTTPGSSGNISGADYISANVFTAPANVTITANISNWNFDTTGDLTFPTGNLVITPVDVALGNSAVIASTDHNLITLSTGANGGVSSLWVEDYANIGTSNIAAVYANPIPGSGNVRIAVGPNGGGGPNLWDFEPSGNATFPGNLALTGNLTGVGASPAPSINGFDTINSITVNASGNITGSYFIGNGSQLTDVGAASVPSQNILPTIQTITIAATSGVGNAGGGGSAFANVTVSNVIPVTEYGVIVTSGTSTQKYATGALGSIPGTVQLPFTTGLNSTPFTVYAYVTSNAGTYYSNSATGTSGICLLAGTQIALSDGTYKAIEDITYTDKMLSWDFDRGCYAETTALWIKRSETGSQYNLLTFSDGTTLRTFDQHRIFNKQAGAFTYPMTDATPIGTITVNEHGQEITLTNKQVIQDTIEYYNVITDYHMNLFSDSVLTSCRFNNIYPITDMKFVKDARTLRTRDEFENVEDRFFRGLRLAEQTIDLKTIEWYVDRLLSTDISTQLELVF